MQYKAFCVLGIPFDKTILLGGSLVRPSISYDVRILKVVECYHNSYMECKTVSYFMAMCCISITMTLRCRSSNMCPNHGLIWLSVLGNGHTHHMNHITAVQTIWTFVNIMVERCKIRSCRLALYVFELSSFLHVCMYQAECCIRIISGSPNRKPA